MNLTTVKSLPCGKNLFPEIKGQGYGFYNCNFSALRFKLVQFQSLPH